MSGLERSHVPSFRIDYGSQDKNARQQAREHIDAIISALSKKGQSEVEFTKELEKLTTDPRFAHFCEMVWDTKQAVTNKFEERSQAAIAPTHTFPMDEFLDKLPDSKEAADIKRLISTDRAKLLAQTATYLQNQFGKEMLISPPEMVMNMLAVAIVRVELGLHKVDKTVIKKITQELPRK